MVWEDIGEKLLQYGLNGFSCTVFAYGQSGAGKSYSVVRCTCRAASRRAAESSDRVRFRPAGSVARSETALQFMAADRVHPSDMFS